MHVRRSEEDQYRSRGSPKLTGRTVIYEEAASTTANTLKSSVRQVISTSSSSSFYNTSTTASSDNSKSLTIKHGKHARSIDSDIYHSEIIDDDDDYDYDNGNNAGVIHSSGTQQLSNSTKSSEERQKRRRSSSADSSDSVKCEVQNPLRSMDYDQYLPERKTHTDKERKIIQDEREEGESISDHSYNETSRRSKEDNEINSSGIEEEQQQNDDENDHSSADNYQKNSDPDERNKQFDEKPHTRLARSRFDDHDEDDDKKKSSPIREKQKNDGKDYQQSDEDDDRYGHLYGQYHQQQHHYHHNHHHKRSRRHSSSTPASSSSKSALTPPISDQHFDQDLIEAKPKLPNYYPAIQGCRRVDEYKCLNRIEEGAYGVVFRAKDVKTGEIVALKRLKMEKEKEGFPITSLREICCILKSQHENVCTVREIVVGDDMNRIFIVMDYVEHDLKSLMTHTMKKQFSISEVKTLMYQLLAGVNHLHDNWIIHRDLKTSNLLLNNRGILKIGDFGLAREYGSPLKPYTPIVVTLWYRAPELLLGIKEYSTPIDIWSVGAIFGELLLMKPLFPGKSELDQLNRIFKDLGTPNDKIWPEYSNLPFTRKMNFSNYPYNRLQNRFDASLSQKGFDLLNKFLTYDPSKRISAYDGLKHPYFEESPRRIDPSMFPTWPSRNEEKDKSSLLMVSRSSDSNANTIQNEPKPPSGGKMYEKLLGGEEDES